MTRAGCASARDQACVASIPVEIRQCGCPSVRRRCCVPDASTASRPRPPRHHRVPCRVRRSRSRESRCEPAPGSSAISTRIVIAYLLRPRSEARYPRSHRHRAAGVETAAVERRAPHASRSTVTRAVHIPRVRPTPFGLRSRTRPRSRRNEQPPSRARCPACLSVFVAPPARSGRRTGDAGGHPACSPSILSSTVSPPHHPASTMPSSDPEAGCGPIASVPFARSRIRAPPQLDHASLPLDSIDSNAVAVSSVSRQQPRPAWPDVPSH